MQITQTSSLPHLPKSINSSGSHSNTLAATQRQDAAKQDSPVNKLIESQHTLAHSEQPIVTHNNPSVLDNRQNINVEQNNKVNDSEIVDRDQSAEQNKQTTNTDEKYTEVELKEIEQLKSREQEVIAHEQAHAAVGGRYTGAPSYDYETGPNGVRYAVSGEVSIDTSEIPGDPQATLRKAKQIKAAALAPAEPSAQDLKVAAKADRMAANARAEILAENTGREKNSTNNLANTGRDRLYQDTDENADSNKEVKEVMSARNHHISNYYYTSSIEDKHASFELQI